MYECLVAPIVEGPSAAAEFLLVVDQAEELWTSCSVDERTAFLRLLAAAAYTQRMRVLVTIRGDFADRLQEDDLIAPLFNDSSRSYLYQLMEPGSSELERMITLPAAKAGIILEQGLLGAILEEARGLASSALPLVMHALHELFKGAVDRQIGLGSYRARGGLIGAVEATVHEVGVIREPVLYTLFDLLYDVRNGVSVRNVVSHSDIKEAGRDFEIEIFDATEKLIAARILVADEGIELAHDALFENWGLLRNWIYIHRRDREIRDELLRDAHRWKVSGERTSISAWSGGAGRYART